MKILAVINDKKNIHLLKMLEEKGHTIKIIKGYNSIYTAKHFDVIVSLSHDTVEEAFNISQQYNIPFYAHIDWIPPWMVFKDSEFNWGHIKKIEYSKKMNFIRKYQNIAMYWSIADVKSMSAKCFHNLMREITGIPDLTIHTLHPIPDINKIKKINEQEHFIYNQITCVSRFIPHKRIQHLIKALQIIEYDGILNLIGSGEDKNLYDAIKGNLNIQYVSELDKYETIANSRLVVSLWNATVALEALILGTPVITYDSEYMKEICGDKITYVSNNVISELAKTIKNELKKNNHKKEYFKYNINIEILEKLLEKTIKR